LKGIIRVRTIYVVEMHWRRSNLLVVLSGFFYDFSRYEVFIYELQWL
jgi:hypothetical protein